MATRADGSICIRVSWSNVRKELKRRVRYVARRVKKLLRNHRMVILGKHIPPLDPQQITMLQRLASLRFETFNESDVREEFLVPLIGLLGYEKNSDYQVLREQSYELNPFFLTVGSKRIKLDYQFNIYKVGFWLMEAKKGECTDPNAPPSISGDGLGQAHFYSHHREIDCPFFGASNGWWTNIFDRDADDPTKPLLAIAHHELPDRFKDLYSLIGATQVTFELKRRMLKRVEQVLSADVDLERTDEYLREIQGAAQRARPKVLENFRRNARLQDTVRNEAFRNYLEQSRPYEGIDTVLMWPLNMGDMATVSDVLSRKVAEYPGSNQYMFFHRLLVAEPRVVTTAYYTNALHLLGTLCRRPNLANVDYPHPDGTRTTPIISLFIDFARMLLFHFSNRPELRVLWAMEALLSRMTKRALVSNATLRNEIAAGVDLQRYLGREEDIAYLGPSPARSIIQVVQSVTLAEMGAFFTHHYRRPERREFDVRGAVEEFEDRRKKFETLEIATDAEYRALVNGLGSEWKEMTGTDSFNRLWDRLGHSACDVLLLNRDLLPRFPDDLQDRLIYLARLKNPFARRCVEALGSAVPTDDLPDAEIRLRDLFDMTPLLQPA
jgi:hypothetical protein